MQYAICNKWIKKRIIFVLNFIKIHIFEINTSWITISSSQLGLGDSLLLKKLLSLVDTFSEKIEVCYVSLDFRDGQVDKHTSDFGCILLTNKFRDEFKDDGTDGLFVGGVDLSDSGVDWHGLVVKLIWHGVSGLSKLNLHLHVTSLRSDHTSSWHWHTAGHRHGHSTWHWHRSWQSWGHWLWCLNVSLASHMLVLVAAVVLVSLTRSTTLTLIVVVATTIIVWLLLVSDLLVVSSRMGALWTTRSTAQSWCTVVFILDIVH